MEELHTARPTHQAGDVPIPRPRKGALRLAAATAIIVVVFAAAAGAPWFGYLNYERDLASIDLNHARRAVVHSAIGLDLRAKAAHAANVIDSFLVERIVDARQIATTPKVVDATREGAWRHAQSGLTLIKIEEVEVLGGTARSRGYFPDVDAHLRHRQRISQYFDEISVTDEHGFNVAYSHPTSDFVQSDEDWWKVAWNTGIWIGEAAFDRSAVEPSIALATRFESATNGERLGVLKVSINLRSIQDLMSNGTHGSPGLELTIFDPRGRILAETASEHATDRILAGDDRAPRVPPDYPSGYTASGGAPPVGFARTAGTTRYASAGARYAGLEWLVTATLDPEALTERRASLDHLADALARAGAWPDLALAAAVSSAALGALAAFFTVWLVLRRVDADAQVLDSLLESLEDGRDLWTDPPRSATFSGITERVRRVAGVGREPKDLEGRRLGAPPPDGAFAVWTAFARAAGVDRTKVNVVPVTFREREPALARGEVDAITGYSFSSWLGARAQGLPEDDLTLILMRHHGLDLYGNAIIASPWLVKERPEALASFLRVAVHAYREAFRVPDAAIEALAMHEPGIHIATETERLRLAIRDNFLTDEVRRFGFGAIDNDRLERAMDQLGETWDYLVRPGITDIFDPSFLPPLEERRVGPAP